MGGYKELDAFNEMYQLPSPVCIQKETSSNVNFLFQLHCISCIQGHMYWGECSIYWQCLSCDEMWGEWKRIQDTFPSIPRMRIPKTRNIMVLHNETKRLSRINTILQGSKCKFWKKTEKCVGFRGSSSMRTTRVQSGEPPKLQWGPHPQKLLDFLKKLSGSSHSLKTL